MKTLASVLAAVVVNGTVLADDLPEPGDYAFAFPLALHGDVEYFGVDVPPALYRSVSDPSLQDTGVYNADGQPVPRIFRRPQAADEDTEQRVALKLLPLHGQEADALQRLRLMLHQVEGGTTLELDTGEPAGPDPAGPLLAYIVDMREIEQPLEALEFDWPAAPRGFIGKVRAEGSDDLEHWRHLGDATLADLEYGDTRIEQDRLNLQRSETEFLRITWQGMLPEWRLAGATGIFQGAATPVDRDWLTLDPVRTDETGREFVFEAGGFPPVDRVQVLLPDENVVVRANILHRRYGEESWRSTHEGVFYNVSRQGSALQSPPAAIRLTRASAWMVRIQAGATGAPVKLVLGWRPDQLLFLAQGTPPFELVAGRIQDRLDRFPQQRLLGDPSIFEALQESGPAGSATLGARMVRGGAGRLEAPAALSWRVLLLWAGLVAAVLLVGWLVWSLMGEMRRPEGQ
jgi:hypothetical protein